MSALSKNQQIDPWIRCLLQEEVPLRGVASTAHVMSQVIASQTLPSGQVLVVNWESGGIRQTYVQGGRTLFSRLSPPAGV